uniref:Uncharacterized protein n=1 Tax=Arion vulgaris TaxID=1028688 RepID=A0A0B7A3K2_9EUPU
MTDNMSGKIIPVGTKDDIKRFQSQKSTVEITSATISPPPPLPPARPGTKPMRQYLPPNPPTGLLPFQCPKCGSSQGDCNHQYDEIGLSIKRTEEEFNQYEALLNTDHWTRRL